MCLSELLLNELKTLTDADYVGTGHATETPYIFLKFDEEPYKVGFRGTMTVWIVENTEPLAEQRFRQIESRIFNGRTFGNYIIRTIHFGLPQKAELPDKRFMQQTVATVIFEEV